MQQWPILFTNMSMRTKSLVSLHVETFNGKENHFYNAPPPQASNFRFGAYETRLHKPSNDKLPSYVTTYIAVHHAIFK
jgi:hypothetical protein